MGQLLELEQSLRSNNNHPCLWSQQSNEELTQGCSVWVGWLGYLFKFVKSY